MHEVFRLRLIVNEMELSLLSTLFVARAETQLSRNVIFSLKFRYRPPNDFLVSSLQIHFNQFLVSSLQIHFNHSCMKYVLNELHEMKEEDLSFPNMCH